MTVNMRRGSGDDVVVVGKVKWSVDEKTAEERLRAVHRF